MKIHNLYKLLIFEGTLRVLREIFPGYAFMQICSKLLIEKMFYYKFFCQTIQCPKKEGGRIPPPSDVSPTEKHADVTRVKLTFDRKR